jgi:hypothetical protein
MPDLKTSILDLVRNNHLGKARAITVAQIVYEFIGTETPLDERTIRKIIRQLNFEGYPILSTTRFPYGIYYATDQSEVKEYCQNLASRMKAILDRMRAVDKIGAKEFLKGQLELF